jgi:acetylornithine/succinyldiaminopimelate/putrescine aminotransferase
LYDLCFQAAHPKIMKEVRGRGLMIGLEFHNDEVRRAVKWAWLLFAVLASMRCAAPLPPFASVQQNIPSDRAP